MEEDDRMEELAEKNMIEELAKKNVSLRFFGIDENDVLEGDYAVELSTEERISLQLIKVLKSRLPFEYYKVVFDNYGDETIIEYIGIEEND